MPEFNTPVDIGNRALQHCGARLMGTAGFAENSKVAAQVAACYGKLRQAELERNTWRFAIKRAPLRAVDTNTMLLKPTLWQQGTTYFVGSIVEDQSGTLWKSVIRNNLGNDPQNSPTAWVPYFGPLTANPFDSSQAYYTGELVYTFAGDGTYNLWESLVSGNGIHPALPNQWSPNTIYQTDNVVQAFPAWSSGTTYAAGQTVIYTDGNAYSSLIGGNLDNVPPSSSGAWSAMPTLTLASQLTPSTTFPVPSAPSPTPIDEWQVETSYSIGAFSIFNAAVYVSLAGNNLGNYPNAAGSTYWALCTGGTLYQSLIDLNQGNNPASAPALWLSVTTYPANALVGASDGYIYKSLVNGNLANNPANGASPAQWQNTGIYLPWTTVFTLGGGNSQWIQIGGAAFPNGAGLVPLNITYPLGTGPASDDGTHNIYHLPASFLRRAPVDPKAGATSFLGAPTNRALDDWQFESNYLVTMDSVPIVFPFVADFQEVAKMPAQFCEGLACRIALEVCEPLTQSTAKLSVIAKVYDKFMGEARTINAIIVGAEEPPLDDWIQCRN